MDDDDLIQVDDISENDQNEEFSALEVEEILAVTELIFIYVANYN